MTTTYRHLQQPPPGHPKAVRAALAVELRSIAVALRERAGELYAGCDGIACLAIAELDDAAAQLNNRARAYEQEGGQL